MSASVFCLRRFKEETAVAIVNMLGHVDCVTDEDLRRPISEFEEKHGIAETRDDMRKL